MTTLENPKADICYRHVIDPSQPLAFIRFYSELKGPNLAAISC